MAARKNPFVKMGRPKGPPKALSASPMSGFAPQMPAAAFKSGGKIGMAAHHDCPRLDKSCSEFGFKAFRSKKG